MNSPFQPFQPFLDQLAHDLQGILPPEEVQATVADARAHLHDLQSRLIAEGMPPDLAAQQALLEFGGAPKLKSCYLQSQPQRYLKLASLALFLPLGMTAFYSYSVMGNSSTALYVPIVALTNGFALVSSALCAKLLWKPLLAGFSAFIVLFTLSMSADYRPGPQGANYFVPDLVFAQSHLTTNDSEAQFIRVRDGWVSQYQDLSAPQTNSNPPSVTLTRSQIDRLRQASFLPMVSQITPFAVKESFFPAILFIVFPHLIGVGLGRALRLASRKARRAQA